MNSNPTWQEELLDTADALEEDILLLSLLCGTSSSRDSAELRQRCLSRIQDYLDQHTWELRLLVRASLQT